MQGIAGQFGTIAETSLPSLGCRKHANGRPNVPHPWAVLFSIPLGCPSLNVERYSLFFCLIAGSVGHA